MPRNNIAFVLDSSSSMKGRESSFVAAFNVMLAAAQERAKNLKMLDKACIIDFNTQASVQLSLCDIQTLRPLSVANYRPTGYTSIYDGIYTAVDHIERADPRHLHKDTANLVLVFTDGDPTNTDRYANQQTNKDRIADREARGNWTFVFSVPHGKKSWTETKCGVSPDNIQEWEATSEAGAQELARNTASGIQGYYAAREAGEVQVKNFFAKVTTDLSKVTKRVLADCIDVTHCFKLHKVTYEERSDVFAETKTGTKYVVGQLYYQLMKPELIQPDKNVLLAPKDSKTLYGGPLTREIVGLPTDGKTAAKVTPGNHSNFDIYVQSKAYNRRLSRGTLVLIDKTKTTSDAATWEPATA